MKYIVLLLPLLLLISLAGCDQAGPTQSEDIPAPIVAPPDNDDPDYVEPEPEELVIVLPDGSTIELDFDDVELDDGTLLSEELNAMIEQLAEDADGQRWFRKYYLKAKFMVDVRRLLWQLVREGKMSWREARQIIRALRRADIP